MVEITRLFWKKAFTSDNVLLGEIDNAELDTNTWQITNFYVGLSGEATKTLGFKRPYLGRVTVCLPASSIETIKDTVILNQTLQELHNLKVCKE